MYIKLKYISIADWRWLAGDIFLLIIVLLPLNNLCNQEMYFQYICISITFELIWEVDDNW